MTRRVLVADVGGTKSDVAVAIGSQTDFQILGHVRGDAGNPRRFEPVKAFTNVCDAVSRLLNSLDLASQDVDFALLAMAGCKQIQMRADAEEFVKSNVGLTAVTVIPDYELIVPTDNDEGAIGLISGTGSIAVGKIRNVTHRAGGRITNDIGSGSWICHAFADTMVANNFAAESLLAGLAQTIKMSKVDTERLCMSLHDRVFTLPGIAEFVLSQVDHDATAKQIAENAASGLAELVVEVAKKLQLTNRNFRLGLGGSILTKCHFLRQNVLAELTERKYVPQQIEIVNDPISKAVLMAMEHPLR